jgi:arsenate reductase
MQRSVLFVCQFNSARSQLAEALARSLDPPDFRFMSAGVERTVVNAEVVASLREIGIDASGHRSKSLEDVAAERFDDVIVLAEDAAEPAAGRFPHARLHRWFMSDPIQAKPPERVPAAVRAARDALAERVARWLREQAA